MKKILTTLMFLGLILSGCTMEIEPVIPDQETGTETGSEGTIRFNICMDAQTKSSISIDEEQLDNVNIYAFCDGLLYANVYSTTPQTVSMKLKKGTTYNLYAVANMGALDAAVQEEDFINNFSLKVGAISELDGHNPLAWSHQGFRLTDGENRISMVMQRLLSKIHFRLDRGTLRGLEVKSVKLCQAANTVRPFAVGGSKALTPSETMTGDQASPDDIAKLNTTGEGVFFYSLENMQGTLLPSNRDPWKKIPDNVSAGDLCTYIEVNASFRQGFFYSGDVTYRFYLGQDSTTNFDIIRNNDMSVVLTLSGDNFGEGQQNISWKVILDTGICREGYATYELGKHIHKGNKLYITERFELNLTLKEEIFNHLDRNINNCYIAPIRSGTEEKIPDVMEFTPLKAVSLAEDDNRFTCIGTLTSRAIWRFGLFDRRTGKLISIIRNTIDPSVIHRAITPKLCVSTYGDRNIFSPKGYGFDHKCAKLNGPEVTYYLYLHDQEHNEQSMGTSQWCDQSNMYDADLFSGEEDGRSIDMRLFQNLTFDSFIHINGTKYSGTDNLEFRYEPAGKDEQVPYIGRIYVKARNDGKTRQDEMVQMVSCENGGTYQQYSIIPKNVPGVAVNATPQFPFMIEPIRVKFYQDSRSPNHQAVFTNTSKLPLHAEGSYHFTGKNIHEIALKKIDPGKPDAGYAYCQGYRSGAVGPSRLVARFWFNTDESTKPSDPFDRYTTVLGSWITSTSGIDRGMCICDISFQGNGRTYEIGKADITVDTKTYDRICLYSKTQMKEKYRMDPPEPSVPGDKYPEIESKSMYLEETMNVEDWNRIFDYHAGSVKKLTIDASGLHLNLTAFPGDDVYLNCSGNCWSTYRDGKGNPPNGPFLKTDERITRNDYPKWETEMEKFKTSAYTRTYWHTAIHTAAGKHIIHPYIYRIEAEIRFQVVGSTAKIIPFCAIPNKVNYVRNHIDNKAPKNDDSVYGYTVDVTLNSDIQEHNIYFLN